MLPIDVMAGIIIQKMALCNFTKKKTEQLFSVSYFTVNPFLDLKIRILSTGKQAHHRESVIHQPGCYIAKPSFC